ncbi:hypothetical protein DMUE_5185 [Dictyocoela muelleri]|nr:hypothetical protein DMUE_5185 [Dictyocoela muelleri]
MFQSKVKRKKINYMRATSFSNNNFYKFNDKSNNYINSIFLREQLGLSISKKVALSNCISKLNNEQLKIKITIKKFILNLKTELNTETMIAIMKITNIHEIDLSSWEKKFEILQNY